MNTMKICICGGGSLGHVCAGVIASRTGVELNLLTGHPNRWHNSITVTDIVGKQYVANFNRISSDPEEVITDQDIILLCLPGFLIEKTLYSIKPYIGTAIVGTVVSSTGFFFFAHEVLGETAKLFGFQRVPFIARVAEYGKTAYLLGYKSSLSVVLENIVDCDFFCKELEHLFITPVTLLDSYYEVALSNSNPLLHTSRLYTMFNGREKEVFDQSILFYKEWTDEASMLLINMDAEFFQLLNVLGVHSMPTILDYYESADAQSLTKKLRSIPAFQTIMSPMKHVGSGWIVDFDSRYFKEDFRYGLRWIKELSDKYCTKTPYIDKVLGWGLDVAK